MFVVSRPRSVTDVWVAGRQLLRNRTLTTLNRNEVVTDARSWQETLTTYRDQVAAEKAAASATVASGQAQGKAAASNSASSQP